MPRRTRDGAHRAASFIDIFQPPSTCVPPPTLHVKDVAQDVAEDVAEDVWGAEKDGSLTAFFVARAIFQRPETPKHTRAAPHASLGRHVKDEHVKDVA